MKFSLENKTLHLDSRNLCPIWRWLRCDTVCNHTLTSATPRNIALSQSADLGAFAQLGVGCGVVHCCILDDSLLRTKPSHYLIATRLAYCLQHVVCDHRALGHGFCVLSKPVRFVVERVVS